VRALWWTIFAKELRETLRDRRTLLMMVVVPVLLYPMLLVVSEQLLLFGQRSLEAEASPVAVMGGAPPELLETIDSTAALELTEIDGAPEAALRNDVVTAIAIFGPEAREEGTRSVTVLYDGASDRSQRGRAELMAVLETWRDTLLERRLEARGLPSTFSVPVAVAASSIARPDEVGGYTLGRILPLLLVVITLLGAFYPAIDLAAGEKERNTLEALLTTPVPPGAIVAGKFATVAVIGVVAAGLNLGSMILTFQTGALQLTEALDIEMSIPLRAVVVIFGTLVPLAVLFGSIFLGLAVRASSFKEAQNALTPVYMLVLVPAMLPVFPGIDFGPLLAVLPVAGVAFFFRDLMVGDVSWLLGGLAVGSTTVYAIGGLVFAARSFGSERVLFGSPASTDVEVRGWSERLRAWGAGGHLPSPEGAVGFVALVAVLFFYGGIRLQIELGETGLLLGEWLLLFVPAVLFVVVGRFDPVRTLSLRAPSRSALGGALLLIFGGMPVVWMIGWLQSFVIPVPWELLEGLEELMTAESAQRFIWLVVVFAATPAICEELVFRGVLLGGTRELEPWRIIVLNGIVFGAFHLSFETVIRFLPTASLGMLIAWAVWRTGSIWIGVLMHFCNNATIVVLTSTPVLRELFSDPEAPPPLWLVPLGVLALAGGVRTLAPREVRS